MMLPSPHRSSNESGNGSSPSKRYRRSTSDITSAIKEGKRWPFFTTSKRPSNADMNTFPGGLPSLVDPIVANDLHQLQKHTLKIRSAAKNVHHVDSAWDDYVKYKDRCFEYCKTLMSAPTQRRESSVVSPTTMVPPQFEHQGESSPDMLNLVAVDTGSSTQSSGSHASSSFRSGPQHEQCQKAAREWENTVKALADTLRSSLQETYYKYDKGATPEGFERICTDRTTRVHTIAHMRNASISKMMSADLDFFPRYDIRFRNYDKIKKDLEMVRALLGTSGIPQNRTIIERRISPTGDVILEFVNDESERHPVFRFRVSSHCLRETGSPIFGHMFNARLLADVDDDIKHSFPLPPTQHVCGDGTEVLLYRMPQTELNTESSLEILLHAAHNHNDKVPREVQFSRFVAIAEVCLRYQCTSPLELIVEHLWLPYWQENATDDMLGEVLLISYVFGLSENFSRLSRIAILKMGSPDYLPCRAWPRKVEEKIVTIRRAKIEQVYEVCRATLNEYLCATSRTGLAPNTDGDRANPLSELRCPRGDRACDAQNLGWYMKSLAELGLLPAILPASPALLGVPGPQTASLLQIIDSLFRITSPPQCHGGICDFVPSFRAAINDIHESLSGPTLLEVSGKRGWALSKNAGLRRSAQNLGNGVVGTNEQLFKIVTRQNHRPGGSHHHHDQQEQRPLSYRRKPTSFLRGTGDHNDDDDDDVCFFNIMSLLDDPRDLRAAAQINRRFYRSYLRNETRLWEGIRAAGAAGMGRETTTPTVHHERGLSEIDGTSCVSKELIPPREKFIPEQMLLLENKQLRGSDANKYAGDIRTQLGPRNQESEGTGGGFGAMGMI